MTRPERFAIDLQAGPLDSATVAVRRVTGRERLSRPYAFDVEVEGLDKGPVDLASAVGGDALLTLRRPDGPERFVHGIVWSAELTGVSAGVPSYRIRIVPRMLRLGSVRRTRVFQAMSVPEVVGRVLDDAGVSHRESLAGSHARREYCIQHDESDLDFVTRLLESEGAFYWFEHDAGSHVMVIADGNRACADLAGSHEVPFRADERPGDLADDEHVSRLARRQCVEPGKVSLRDYDFEHPELDVSGEFDSGDALEMQWHEYPGAAPAGAANRAAARVRLEQLRFGAETFAGEGTCVHFSPGSAFEVTGHPDPSFSRKLLLVRVDCEARQQEAAGAEEEVLHGYRNSFTALDVKIPYRPRRERRPAAAAEVATVVGPAGEEVWTDQHGRVKVRFHWDREGPGDDRASCWVRVAQSWAGPSFGASFLPRVGQEVLVRFLEGDPDRPLVVGSLYDAQRIPPLALPHEKTRSTLRTNTSPGGGGSNELRFEDSHGDEEVWLHAQRDLDAATENDERQTVSGHEGLEVQKDRAVEVRGGHRLRVAGDDGALVGGSRIVSVAGERQAGVAQGERLSVGGQRSLTAGGERHLTVSKATVETVAAAAALNVGAAYAVNAAGMHAVTVAGVKSSQIGGESLEIVGAFRSEIVGGSSSIRTGGDHEIEVEGNVTADARKDRKDEVGGKLLVEAAETASWTAKTTEIQADKLSFVVDGKVVLAVSKSGNVELGVSKLTVDGKSIALSGAKVKKIAAGSAASATPQVQALQPIPGDTATVDVELTDQDGNPIANEWFRVEFPDGTVREGRLDAAGRARVPGPKDGNAKVTFPRMHEKAWSRR